MKLFLYYKEKSNQIKYLINFNNKRFLFSTKSYLLKTLYFTLFLINLRC